jgi:hypothetical protein
MLAQTNLIQNAHRMSEIDVDAAVINIYAGQLFQLNDQRKWVYADGTRKAYPTLNDRFPGQGLGFQGERLEGRDNVSRTGKITVLKGNFEIGTDQYDKDATYTNGAPLVASTVAEKKGLITMYDSANPNHKAHLIIGFVTRVPETDDDMLRYEA